MITVDIHRRVEEAFDAAPRKAYLPRSQRRFARVDKALPIGWRQTNSQPTTVRNMLTLLDPRPGERVGNNPLFLRAFSRSGGALSRTTLLVGSGCCCSPLTLGFLVFVSDFKVRTRFHP